MYYYYYKFECLVAYKNCFDRSSCGSSFSVVSLNQTSFFSVAIMTIYMFRGDLISVACLGFLSLLVLCLCVDVFYDHLIDEWRNGVLSVYLRLIRVRQQSSIHTHKSRKA